MPARHPASAKKDELPSRGTHDDPDNEAPPVPQAAPPKPVGYERIIPFG